MYAVVTFQESPETFPRYVGLSDQTQIRSVETPCRASPKVRAESWNAFDSRDGSASRRNMLKWLQTTIEMCPRLPRSGSGRSISVATGTKRSGGRVDAPRIADYLDGIEGEPRTALWLELVMLDQELRRDTGDEPTLADYHESCPDGMILLDASTAELDSIGRCGQRSVRRSACAVSSTRTGPWTGPSRSSIRRGPRSARSATAAGPTCLPSTAGPPPEAGAAGLEGLALARPGFTLGDYVLLEKLGAGGMGVVFKARQKGLNRVVALKMIKAGILADERHIRLFRSEAEAVAALDHPNIVPVLDNGEHEGMLYYSMKLVDGQDLGQGLGRYRDQPAAIARLVARVAEAIAHAHQRGVLHRDLKPSNILVDEHGEPHVIDFGLAKRLDAAPGDDDRQPGGHARLHVARAGPRQSGRDHHRDRRLRPGDVAVRAVDGPAAVLGQLGRRDPPPGRRP